MYLKLGSFSTHESIYVVENTKFFNNKKKILESSNWRRVFHNHICTLHSHNFYHYCSPYFLEHFWHFHFFCTVLLAAVLLYSGEVSKHPRRIVVHACLLRTYTNYSVLCHSFHGR